MWWRKKRPAQNSGGTDLEAAHVARLAGDVARNASNWDEAIRQYQQVLAIQPENTPIQIQLGHAFGQVDRLADAEAAYRAAIAQDPDNSDAYLHLGHALKRQGHRIKAADAYIAAVMRDPENTAARNEVIALGERGRLPESVFARTAQMQALATLADRLREAGDLARNWVTISTYPVEAYPAFRQAHPIQPPPPLSGGTDRDVWVHVHAIGHAPWAVRLTLEGLIDQSHTQWRAIVTADSSILDHPVAGIAVRDDRITLRSEPGFNLANDVPTDAPILLIEAGYQLDRNLIGWFEFAAQYAQADAVYCDHDHHDFDWLTQESYRDPVLQSMPDIHDLSTTPMVPAAVMICSQDALQGLATVPADGPQARRAVLIGMAGKARVAHVPRLLLSRRLSPGEDAIGQRATDRSVTLAVPEPLEGRLLVVVPTRDAADMLASCLTSLRRLATRPDLIDYVVIDNRSQAPETRSLLQRLAEAGEANILTMDEPFNWARFNNQAVAAYPGRSVLVFANNDTEMLSSGWDEQLRKALNNDKVGLVGTRLLYEDRTLQHAGVALGAGNRRPVHEGLGAPLGSAGPLRRWARQRVCSAVTGAFMAVRAEVFEQLGGFDEDLPVAYNDIDFCLKGRDQGFKILYVPEVELLHFESQTRGLDADQDRELWDAGELSRLYGKWGEWIFDDPGKNPHWVSTDARVFEGLRDLSVSQVLKSLRTSAEPNPWGHHKEWSSGENR